MLLISPVGWPFHLQKNLPAQTLSSPHLPVLLFHMFAQTNKLQPVNAYNKAVQLQRCQWPHAAQVAGPGLNTVQAPWGPCGLPGTPTKCSPPAGTSVWVNFPLHHHCMSRDTPPPFRASPSATTMQVVKLGRPWLRTFLESLQWIQCIIQN